MNAKRLGGLGFVLVCVLWMVAYPLLVLWALNTLWGLTLPYTLTSWGATAVLLSVTQPPAPAVWTALWKAGRD
ncbi:MAG: hypothetical protein ACO3DI_03955 [Ilumatobacteraceae bacterium]